MEFSVTTGGQKGRETCPFRALDGFNEIRLSALERMAGTTRLELATSAVTDSVTRRGRSAEHRPREKESNCFALNSLGPGTSQFVCTLPGGFESCYRGKLRFECPTTGDARETAFAAGVLPLAFDDGLSRDN